MADFAKLILAAETGDLKQAQRELAKLVKQAGLTEKGVTGSSKKMASAFALAQRAVAALGLTMSAGLIARKVFSDFTTFDREVTKINTLVGVSREQTDAWRKDMIALSGTVGRSTSEMASGMFFITSAGLKGAAAMGALEAAGKGAAIGLGETNIIADAATSAVNAYGAANLSAKKAVAILAATVREGKAEASAIAPVLGALLPVTQSLGVGFDQVGASIAAMTRLGAPATEAATSIQAILTTLAKGGTKDADEALGKMGLSFAGLRRSVREDGLLDTLLQLKDSIGDNEEAMAKIFPNVRALRGLLNLLGENSEEARKIFASVADTVEGDLDAAFEKWAASTEGRYTIAMQSISKHMTGLGEKTVPLLISAMEGLVKVVDLALANSQRLGTYLAVGAVGGAIAFRVALLSAAAAARAFIVSMVATRAALIRTGWGVAAVAIGEIVYQLTQLKGSTVDATAPVEDFTDRVNELTGSVQDLAKAQRDLAAADINSAMTRGLIEAEETAVRISDLNAKIASLANVGGHLGRAVIPATKERDELQKKLSLLTSTYDKNAAALKKLNEFTAEAVVVTGKYVPAVEDLEAAKEREAALDKRASELKRELMTDQELLTEKVAEAAVMLDTHRFSQEEYNETVKRAYEATDLYAEAQKRMAELDRRAVKVLDMLIPRAEAYTDALRANTAEALRNAPIFERLVSVADKYTAALNTGVSEALRRAQARMSEMEQFSIQAARNIQTAFADFLFNPFEGGLSKMFSNFSATLRRMAAEILASKLAGKIGGLFGGLSKSLGGLFGGLGNMILPGLGAVAAAFLPKIGSALFGGKFKTTDAGLQLGLGGAGVTGSQFEEQHRKGGLFRGSKDRTLITALDATTAQGFQDAYDSIIDSAQVVFAGIGADIDRSVLEAVRVAGLRISTAGKSEAEIQALIDGWFDSLSAAVIGTAAQSSGALGLLALARDGETASQTIMRLGSQIQGVNDVLAVMGTQLLSVSVDGAAFADNMVQLAGGVDALAGGVSSFVDHFHSEERKFERIQSDLLATFAALGLELPATRDAVTALVDGLDLTTEAGQRAFVAITGASSAMNSFFLSLEAQAAAAADAAAASARAAEEARAAEAAAVAQLIQESKSGTDAALGALRASIQERKSALQRERDESARAAQANQQASQQANQAAINAAQSALSALSSEVQSIVSAAGSLRTSIAGNETRAREEALATVRKALATGNMAGVGEAARVAANVESGSFSTAADFRREQARTLALLGRLEDEGEKQVDQAEAAVRAIQSQTASMERAASMASAQAQSRFDDEMAALDKQLAEAEEQVNLLRGIETGVLSMAEALAQFRTAIEVERGLTGGPQAQQEQRETERRQSERIENVLRSIEDYGRSTARTNARLLAIDDRRWREELTAEEV